MKTTSFEISKKLAEIGFEAETPAAAWRTHFQDEGIYGWRSDMNRKSWIPAYDLETILDALPKVIISDLKLASPAFVCYGQYEEEFLSCDKKEGENWADTAARLLILLHKKGLINFRK